MDCSYTAFSDTVIFISRLHRIICLGTLYLLTLLTTHELRKTLSAVIQKIIFSFLILFIFIGGIEITLRVIDIDLYQKNQFFHVNRDIDFPDVYKKDQNLFWKFRTSQTINSKAFSDITYHINSDDFRGKELTDKKGLRILALGNSCTFGWGVDQKYIWTTLLEQKLRTTFPNKNIEIINAGVPGYSSFQGMNYFKNELIEKVQPDIVLIMFGWNDQWAAGKNISDAEQQMPNMIILGLQNLFSKFKFYQFFRKIILSTTEKQKTVPLDKQSGKKRVSVAEFNDNLKSIIRAAKEKSIIPILMVPPVASVENYFKGKISKFHNQHKRYQDQIINSAKYEDIHYINHQPNFDLYNDLFDNPNDDPIHFNIKGQKVFTETIETVLIPLIDSL